MKKHVLLFLLILSFKLTSAICPTGFTEVIVQIIPDAYTLAETSWQITDLNGNVITSGSVAGDTICVPDTNCMTFSIHDTYGDGIYAPGGYWLYLNGVCPLRTSTPC